MRYMGGKFRQSKALCQVLKPFINEDTVYARGWERLSKERVVIINNNRSGGKRVMTCKDCVHFESCKNLYETHGEGLSGDSYVCDFFKDRSRFVELPCKVGDTIYRLKDGKVTKEQVVEFGISSRGVVLYRTLGYELGYSGYFGNSLFFSKEEAEQALKEK